MADFVETPLCLSLVISFVLLIITQSLIGFHGMFRILIIALTTFAWFIGYRVAQRLFPYRVEEWSCRVVTTIHATIVTLIAGLAWYLGPDPFTHPGGPSTMIQEIAITLSLGYFMFDLAWCLTNHTEGITMLIHHIVSVLVLSRVLIKGTGGTEATAGLFCMEITNPFLQGRWLLRTAGYKDTKYHLVSEILFVILFVFFRMIWGTVLSLTIVSHSSPDQESKVSCVLLYLLSWVFLYFIAIRCRAKYIAWRQKITKSTATAFVELSPILPLELSAEDSDGLFEAIGTPIGHSTYRELPFTSFVQSKHDSYIAGTLYTGRKGKMNLANRFAAEHIE